MLLVHGIACRNDLAPWHDASSRLHEKEPRATKGRDAVYIIVIVEGVGSKATHDCLS